MNSLLPFQFATLARSIVVPSADSATVAAPASAPGPVLFWSASVLAAATMAYAQEAAVEHDDDYEMSMNDIEESDRRRFQLESMGRCYAAHWPYDIELDVWRSIFLSYPEDVQNGRALPSSDHKSGMFWRDIKKAREDINVLSSGTPQPPKLQHANAEPGY